MIIIFNELFFSQSANCIDGSCRTTTGKNGVCKLLDKCSYTTDLRRRYGYSRYQHYLNTNFCGYYGPYPTICCPVVKFKKPSYQTVEHTKPLSATFKNTNKKLNQVDKSKEIKKPKIKEPTAVIPQTLLPKSCGKKYEARIIGGQSAQLNEFPWLALLEYEKCKYGFY